MKTCTKCMETKDLNEFSKSKSKKDGFFSWCKECWKNRNKEIKSNPIMQLKKEIASSIRIENKILLKDGKKICGKCNQIFNIVDIWKDGRCIKCKNEINSIWRSKNKEKIKEIAKEYRLKNKEKLREKKREYRLKKKLEKEVKI